jgi:flagellar protein FliL
VKLLKNKIALAIGGLLLGAGCAFAATTVPGSPLAPKPPAAEKQAEHPKVGIIYPTRERIVNLADAGILRYLKATISLELLDHTLKGEPPKGEEYKKKQEELTKELKAQAPIIDDQITSILTARTSTELMTAEGKQKLKDEIKSKLNKALGEDRVLAVYFVDFIIQ